MQEATELMALARGFRIEVYGLWFRVWGLRFMVLMKQYLIFQDTPSARHLQPTKKQNSEARSNRRDLKLMLPMLSAGWIVSRELQRNAKLIVRLKFEFDAGAGDAARNLMKLLLPPPPLLPRRATRHGP